MVRFYKAAPGGKTDAHVALIVKLHPETEVVDLHVWFADGHQGRMQGIPYSDDPKPGHWRPLP